MNDTFDYEKQKWEKNHQVPDFKVGELVLVSTFNFINVKGQKKLKDSYVGPCVIVALHTNNAVQVELSGELENKHPTFSFSLISLIKSHQPTDKELFSSRNPTPLTVPPVEQDEDKKIKKVIKERRLRVEENILSDIEIQYMKMNGWQNQRYLTQINSQENLDMKEGHKPEYVYKCSFNYLI
ncbi:hypothetical protein O181_045848 [Austropuccinia psidii MF-1]|uniref:Uncharacterized protein n=1 Tax=Austropuccinia psidii MF-1 TaxID=1389203 RepID=A0A9Q3DR37_9BASI|nr:hypothetical protein [Austropuccinia psidii MF-1]